MIIIIGVEVDSIDIVSVEFDIIARGIESWTFIQLRENFLSAVWTSAVPLDQQPAINALPAEDVATCTGQADGLCGRVTADGAFIVHRSVKGVDAVCARRLSHRIFRLIKLV